MDESYITTIVWRHKWLVAACVAVAVAAAGLATLLAEKVYEARATIQAGALSDRSGASAEGTHALARTYAEVLTSGSFLERIRPQLPGSPSVRDLQDRLKAEAIRDTAIVRLQVRARSPLAARNLAARITDGFITSLRVDTAKGVHRRLREIDSMISQLTDQIEQPVPGTPARRIDELRASREALVGQGAELVADGVSEAVSARRVGPPSASSDAVSPRLGLNLLAGIMLGLLLGAALAWWRERRAPALRSAEEAAALSDAPLLAAIPLRRRIVAGDPVLVEAYDVLHATLKFQSSESGPQVVTVVSENARVGKSSTVDGLAYAAERAGRRVVVVDADLRLADLSSRLCKPGGVRLPEVIAGTVSIDEALVNLTPRLSMIAARPAMPDPPSLLNSDRMREVIRTLGMRFDLVLIDSPPVGHLADGLLLSSLSDSVLVVVRLGTTSRPDLIRGVKRIRQTRTPIAGLVVFTAIDLDTSYYPSRPPSPAPRENAAVAQ